MKSTIGTILIILLPILSFAETFRVGLPVIPQFNPITNQLNSANYVGLHIYYPLFKMNKVGEIESDFLDLNRTKADNSKFTSYKMCLKPNLLFSDKTPISSVDFKRSVEKFGEMYSHMAPIKKVSVVDNLCIALSLKSPTPNLFKRLTGMASTIIKAAQVDENYPIGYGPYSVVEKKNNFLKLVYASDEKPRFDVIEFILVKNGTTEFKHKIHDTNHLPPSEISTNNGQGLMKINAPTLKVYTLVINLLSLDDRKSAKCLLSKIDWTQVYGLQILKQHTFLPLPSSHEQPQNSSIQENCKYEPKKFTMLVVDLYDSKKVVNELKNHKLDKQFEVVTLDTTKFAEWAFSGKPYIALMAFDSSGSISSLDGDFSVYFESFFTIKNRIVTQPVVPVKTNITKAFLPKTTVQERMTLMKNSDEYLVKNSYLYPLGRVNRSFLFPKDLEIVSWADYFSGFPEINRIR